MSTLVQIIMEAERTSFLEDVLRRERFGSRTANSAGHHPDPHPDTPYGTAFANARDTDMGRPEVRVVGRAPQSTKPIQSMGSGRARPQRRAPCAPSQERGGQHSPTASRGFLALGSGCC
jgi:hypothetical protein